LRIEADDLPRVVVALDGHVAAAELDDGLRVVAVVGVEDRLEPDGGGAVESDDVAVGEPDLGAAAAAGGHFIARENRQVDTGLDLAPVLPLLDDGAAVVVREVRVAALRGGSEQRDRRECECEDEGGFSHGFLSMTAGLECGGRATVRLCIPSLSSAVYTVAPADTLLN